MADDFVSHNKPLRMRNSTSWPTLKKCFQLESTFEDRISMLSDDIIVSIISHLKLVEAARTSVLSHRWRYLWTYTTGVLDFDKTVRTDDRIQHSCKNWESDEAARCRFIEWVNLVLNLHRSLTIEEFRVCFGLREASSDVINSWIKFALQKCVRRLVLDFSKINLQGRQYSLRTQVFSNCSHGSMTALHLRHVGVTQEVIVYILSCFPLLQQLHIESSSSLKNLIISGPSPHLRCLEIKGCPSMRYLEVHAINIVSFAYHGPKTNMYFKEIPHLIEADLDTNLTKNLCHFSSYLSRLESLVLDFKPLCALLHSCERDFPELPSFGKLKQLEVSFSGINFDGYVLRCTKLLQSCPSLQRFVLKIYDITGKDISKTKKQREVRYQHKQLKVMEFVGFLGHDKDVEIVVSLLEQLPSLQKVVIDPRQLCSFRYGRQRNFRSRKEPQMGLPISKAQEMRNYLPMGAELFVISPSKKPSSVTIDLRYSL